MTDEEKAKVAELEAKIEELTKSLTDQKAELEKANGRVENAEKKFNEMGEETGDNRKAVAEAAKEVMRLQRERDEAKENFSKASNELAEVKKTKGPKAEEEQSDKGLEKKTPEEIEASLTDDEGKVLDEAFKNASDELKAQIKADPKVRKDFLLEAKEAAKAADESDLSSWRKKPAQKPSPSSDDAKAKIRELFNRENKRGSNLPNGPSSTSRSDFVHQRPMRPKRSEEKVLG